MSIRFIRSIKRSKCVLLIVFFLTIAINVSRGDNEDKETPQSVTISAKDLTLSQLIWELKEQTNITFTYNTEDIDKVMINSLDVTDQPVLSVLNLCLQHTDLEYTVVEGTIVIKKKSPSTTQQPQQEPTFTLSGHISDEEGEPLIGVNVLIKGLNKGTVSDIEGNYTLNGVQTGQTIKVSYVGKKTMEQVIAGGQKVMNFTMKNNEDMLKDVVITGYQTISRERATGSFAIITPDKLKNKTENNIISMIEGLVPGMSNDGESRRSNLRIRGTTSLNADKEPLFVVDGVPFQGNGNTNNPLSIINPNDVANITVLKDAAAASIYGARASNGVIVINTRNGRAGKTKVNYSGSVSFSSVASLDHLNLINSKEYVDYLQTAFNTVSPSGFAIKDNYIATSQSKNTYQNPVIEALVAHQNGSMNQAELDKQLAYYSSLDNRDQIYDAFSRTAVTHQHNLGISGGNEGYKFYLSMNYLKSYPHDKFEASEQYGINSKNEFSITSKLKAYVNVSASFQNSASDNYNTANYSSLLLGYPSFQMLKDNEGKSLPFPNYGTEGYIFKSQHEIDRLISIGLLDQTYYPLEDMHTSTQNYRSNYLRIQGGLHWEIADGLTANVIYQQETSHNKNAIHYTEKSYYMRNNINDAAQVDPETKKITYNIPLGGRLDERYDQNTTFTFRTQLDYHKTFNDDHFLNALAGAERRGSRSTASSQILLGFKENGMSNIDYNPGYLSYISGTEAISGYYSSYGFGNNVSDYDNRYVSFYGNASYSYKSRYDLSGSVRVDESNLFARTADNKWKPIWSIGTGWHLNKEQFMQNINWIDRLSLRLTYGIGGNMATSASAFTIIYAMGTSKDIGGNAAYIREPANPQLSWEKTATFNTGIDYAILGSRISGSIDLYDKYTTNLYGEKQSDPTIGWSSKLVNYGKMRNKGIETAFNISILDNKQLKWNTGLIYSYNQNKLLEIEGTEVTRDMYLYTREVLVVGKPLQSIYSTRYAGLDTKGVPQFYNQQNEKVDFESLKVEDLIYAGTSEPKQTMSLLNDLTYKQFDFSFKVVYYGGHVLRNQRQRALSGFEETNFSRESLNFWKKPGDENDFSKSPALDPRGYYQWGLGWLTRDTAIKKANYLKLRNLNVTYRVPQKILNQFKIEQMSLTFQANNLFTWTANGDIDPESYFFIGNGVYSVGMRQKPEYSLNVNINF